MLKHQETLKKQLLQLEKKERKILSKKMPQLMKQNNMSLQVKVEEKVPQKVRETLEKAFATSFKVVFEKGLGVIEKSYDRKAKEIEYDINHYAMQRQVSIKGMKRFDQSIKKSTLINSLLTTVEGGALGVLGIGLPDIPVFIGMLLKNIYEMSLSYGFDYTKPEEQIYILYLICAGVTKDQTKANYCALLDEMVSGVFQIDLASYNRDVLIKEVSHQLTEYMLLAKFIQGIPFVGIIGGAYNFAVMKDLSEIAEIKYKKRYLTRVLQE